MAKSGLDLEAELDGVYAAPLPEFVDARNALAKNLLAAGRKDDAARVKALKKPSAAAWAVNRVALSAPRLFEALVAAGDRLRANPSAMKDAMRERRDALNEARRAAERSLAEAGHGANPEVLRRVSTTLEAVATYGSAPGGPVAGRLTETVEAPGFDEIAFLGILPAASPAGPAPERPPAAPRPVARPEAQEPVHDVARAAALDEGRRREARKVLTARTKEASRARADLRAAESALGSLRHRKASLEAALSVAAAEEAELESAVSAARKAVEAADAAEQEARAGAGG